MESLNTSLNPSDSKAGSSFFEGGTKITIIEGEMKEKVGKSEKSSGTALNFTQSKKQKRTSLAPVSPGTVEKDSKEPKQEKPISKFAKLIPALSGDKTGTKTQRITQIHFSIEGKETKKLVEELNSFGYMTEQKSLRPHSHPCLALERSVVRDHILFTLCKGNKRILDIGGSPTYNAKYKKFVRSVSPLVLRDDYHRCKGIDPTLFCNCLWKDCMCEHFGEDQQPDVSISIHSLYYLTPEEVAKAVVSTSTHTHYAAVHMFDKSHGKIHEAEYHIRDNKVSMTVPGNLSSYVHDDMSWLRDLPCIKTTDLSGKKKLFIVWTPILTIGNTTILEFNACPTEIFGPKREPGATFTDLGYFKLYHHSDRKTTKVPAILIDEVKKSTLFNDRVTTTSNSEIKQIVIRAANKHKLEVTTEQVLALSEIGSIGNIQAEMEYAVNVQNGLSWTNSLQKDNEEATQLVRYQKSKYVLTSPVIQLAAAIGGAIFGSWFGSAISKSTSLDLSESTARGVTLTGAIIGAIMPIAGVSILKSMHNEYDESIQCVERIEGPSEMYESELLSNLSLNKGTSVQKASHSEEELSKEILTRQEPPMEVKSSTLQ
jgi:hypothetical protein